MTRRVGAPAAALAATLSLVLLACGSGGGSASAEAPDPAEVVLGERLFRETRFAQLFAASGNDVNEPLVEGDPAVETQETTGDPLPGAYAGLSMNCATCHLVDEQDGAPGAGMRTYTDFARRSPIPAREDGRTLTPRNSPPLVGASVERAGEFFLHFDGEFESVEALVEGTLTGRNYGWTATERAEAVAQIARVIRDDDGSDGNADEHGGRSYRTTFAAKGNLLPAELILPPEFRLDVDAATDEEILAAVVKVIAAYVRGLLFASDPATGEFTGSPFDAWLAKNGLPRAPDPGEAPLDYARRLRGLVERLASPRDLTPGEGRFSHHVQSFAFGPQELKGLRIFLAEPPALPAPLETIAAGRVGSCISCHQPPQFTDFSFHNVGVAQVEFDSIHGDGAFEALPVPSLATRSSDPATFLPAHAANPAGDGPFLDVPSLDRPGRTDLGLWNVFANPAVPGPQAALRTRLLAQLALPPATTDDDLLPRTIAWFKTPSLRDLGHGGPYFHDGGKDTIPDVVRHYLDVSPLARSGLVRNAAPELSGIVLREEDLAPLAAFLKALNEDYE
jgi:cytochrome c peroxidase